MKLYGFPPSPNTWKVRAVAAHLGIPLQLEFVDLTKPRTPDYLALNPSGRAPTLVDGDLVLPESTAIIQYLAGQKPNPLWPDNARARGEIMRWQSWDLAHWSKDGCVPLIFQRLVKGLLKLGPPDEAILAKGTEAFNREAKLLDAHLAKSPTSSARNSRSPTSPSPRRCSMPSRPRCRWRPIRTCAPGSTASRRCRPGRRPRRRRLPPPHRPARPEERRHLAHGGGANPFARHPAPPLRRRSPGGASLPACERARRRWNAPARGR